MGTWVTKDEGHSQVSSDGAEDAAVCSDLPEDIVACIQTRLPLVSLVRSRAICKAWKEAVQSPRLLKERLEARGGARDSLLCVSGFIGCNVVYRVYDPGLNRWYQLRQEPWLKGPERVQLSHVGAGGGALLSVAQGSKMGSIPYLGNPVTRSWTRLPVLPDYLLLMHVKGVLVDATTRCFKMVAVRDHRLWDPSAGHDVIPTFVFDSALRTWSVATYDVPDNAFFNDKFCDGVFVGSVLYCPAKPEIHGLDHSNLLAYDLERASWSLLVVTPSPVVYTCNLKFVNIRERLVCVALGWPLGKGTRDLCMYILEMDFKRMTWTVVDAMPAFMFAQFRELCFSGITLPLRGIFTQLFIISEGMRVAAGQDSELYIMKEKLDKIVAVDLRQMPPVWKWLPSAYPSQFFRTTGFQCLDPWLEFGSRKQVV